MLTVLQTCCLIALLISSPWWGSSAVAWIPCPLLPLFTSPCCWGTSSSNFLRKGMWKLNVLILPMLNWQLGWVKKKKLKVRSYSLRTLKALLYCLLALRVTDEKSFASLSFIPLRWLVWHLWEFLGSTSYPWSRLEFCRKVSKCWVVLLLFPFILLDTLSPLKWRSLFSPEQFSSTVSLL